MTEKEKKRAREADKYVVRFPDGMRPNVERLAKERGVSMNTAIVEAIELYVAGQDRKKLLLNALLQRLPQHSAAPLPAQEASIPEDRRDYLDGLCNDED